MMMYVVTVVNEDSFFKPIDASGLSITEKAKERISMFTNVCLGKLAPNIARLHWLLLSSDQKHGIMDPATGEWQPEFDQLTRANKYKPTGLGFAFKRFATGTAGPRFLRAAGHGQSSKKVATDTMDRINDVLEKELDLLSRG